MAAPLSAYKGIINTIQLNSSAVQHYVALLLSSYCSAGATAAERIAQLKSLFHLDHIEFLSMLDSGNVIECFVGYVIEGGANASYHNLMARKGKIGAINTIETYVMLNDAGLNCKPQKPSFRVTGGVSTVINVAANTIILQALFSSSYYNDTTSSLLDVAESENPENVEQISLGSFDKNTSVTHAGTIVQVPASLIMTVGLSYVLKLRAINEEGNIVSDQLTLSPSPAPVNLKFGSTLDAAIATASASTVYMSRRMSDAVAADNLKLYSNLAATLFASSGYYLSITAEANGTYRYYRIVGTAGLVTEINAIVNRQQDVYHYYSSVSPEAAIQSSSLQRILYYKVLQTPSGSDFEQRRYYAGTLADSAYATQGYYVKEDRETSIYVDSDGTSWVLTT